MWWVRRGLGGVYLFENLGSYVVSDLGYNFRRDFFGLNYFDWTMPDIYAVE